jgi:hypothetical protein
MVTLIIKSNNKIMSSKSKNTPERKIFNLKKAEMKMGLEAAKIIGKSNLPSKIKHSDRTYNVDSLTGALHRAETKREIIKNRRALHSKNKD